MAFFPFLFSLFFLKKLTWKHQVKLNLLSKTVLQQSAITLTGLSETYLCPEDTINHTGTADIIQTPQ